MRDTAAIDPVLRRPKPAKKEIPYCQHSVDEIEIDEVVATLKSPWLTTGPRSVEFEQRFAEYLGCRHTVAVSSCTAGLHLALRTAGVESGDEVLTTPMTFCATAEVVAYLGAKPVFVDIEPDSFNINPAAIEARITARTKAIMPVHYGGIPCDMVAIQQIAERHGLAVIEDAAHASGSRFEQERMVGNGPNPAVFSFYPTKNMTTVEGGIIATNDADEAERLKVLSLHGISKDAWKRYSSQGQWYYEIHELGYKYNFTDLQAAIGLQQLKKLDGFNAVRGRYARIYFDALNDMPEYAMPAWYQKYFESLCGSGLRSSWHLFVLMLNLDRLSIDRNQFIEELKARGIGASVHFIPLHLQPYYAKQYGYRPGDFPVAENTYNRIVSLPLYPKLHNDDILYIIAVLRDLARQFRI